MADCRNRGVSCHDALMDRCGWPAIPYDGQLLVTHQDALLMGGKVQAPAGFADHVRFLYPDFCERCASKLCIEMCSGQAITPGPRWRPGLRPREMRPLRRLPVELHHAVRRTTRSAATSLSAPAPGDCTRRRIRGGKPRFPASPVVSRACEVCASPCGTRRRDKRSSER